MKFNKWTLGLAAVGAVSFVSAVQAADEPGLSAVSAWTKGITISGYVDTSVDLALETDASGFGGGVGAFQGSGPSSVYDYYDYYKDRGMSGSSNNGFPTKQNGFNLNVVKLTIEKPMGEEEWASGFKVDLLYGPDAVNYNTSAGATGGQQDSASHSPDNDTADFAIKQAYVALRTPVGNGIDWKIGVFDTIVGYEVFESGSNPNFTRSYGYSIEPTEHTGILGSYRINDSIALSIGVANTLMAGINARNDENGLDESSYWNKTWMGSIALTAPKDWGWAAGSSLYGGIVSGFAGGTESQDNYYLGGTLNTPVAGLTVGAAFDYVNDGAPEVWSLAGYASYQANEKLSLHGRVDYITSDAPNDPSFFGVTATVQYNLWANVISRLELRWDESSDLGFDQDYVSLFANIIYKF
jgi:hypothetical protein